MVIDCRKIYIGHKGEDGSIQLLHDHLAGVAETAEMFAKDCGAGDHAYRTGIDVELIVNDNQVIRLNAVSVQQLFHWPARNVHEALRLGQHDIVIVIYAFSRERTTLVFPIARTAGIAKQINSAKPGIVSGLRILFAGISQANY